MCSRHGDALGVIHSVWSRNENRSLCEFVPSVKLVEETSARAHAMVTHWCHSFHMEQE